MAPYLPPTADAVLDIGCGMAGIDVLLWRLYRPRLFLLDGTGMAAVRTGFHGTLEWYNSMPIARKLLELNGVPTSRIVEGTPARCDLAISLLSWGFHYPVSTYLPLVKTVLSPGGRLILDIRKGTDGLAALEADFEMVGTVSSGGKVHRVCVQRRSENERNS